MNQTAPPAILLAKMVLYVASGNPDLTVIIWAKAHEPDLEKMNPKETAAHWIPPVVVIRVDLINGHEVALCWASTRSKKRGMRLC